MMKKNLFVVLCFAFVVWAAPSAQAGEETAGDYFVGIGTKFGRGLWNVVSSPAEIPCNMTFDIQDKGGVGALTGFGKGTVFMLRRILVGVCEVGTFIIPMEATLPKVCSKCAVTA